MGSLYRSAHEFIFVYKSGRAKHINNVELGRFGRSRTNVAICRHEAVREGPGHHARRAPDTETISPCQRRHLDCSKRGGIVLDAFAGSGTTLLAAEKTGRRGYGIELDSHYADLIIQRFEEIYGLKAIHIESDLSFDRVRAKRTDATGMVKRVQRLTSGKKKSDRQENIEGKANISRKHRTTPTPQPKER
jgi:hypothetical protein